MVYWIVFKVQYEPISKKSLNSKYTGITQTIVTIFREEGLFGLWKGHLTGNIITIKWKKFKREIIFQFKQQQKRTSFIVIVCFGAIFLVRKSNSLVFPFTTG